MHTLLALDTLRRIAHNPLATAGLWGPIVVPALALVLFLASKAYLGGWPDLWRFRRRVLPIVDRLSDGDDDEPGVSLRVFEQESEIELEFDEGATGAVNGYLYQILRAEGGQGQQTWSGRFPIRRP